jgi:hypothetical protein
MYVTVSIGNTDNKLTQQEWNNFVTEIQDVIMLLDELQIRFFGGASNWEPWQNVAWILEGSASDIEHLHDAVKSIRRRYDQDSAFMLFGQGMFV